RKDWKTEDSVSLVQGGSPPGTALNTFMGRSGSSTRTGTITTDSGALLPAMLTGESLLINGKDISGNLGSKTTHGANSPIIENIRDSQIAAGEGNSVIKDSPSTRTVNISLSLALSVSVALNLYLLRQIRRRSESLRVEPKKS